MHGSCPPTSTLGRVHHTDGDVTPPPTDTFADWCGVRSAGFVDGGVSSPGRSVRAYGDLGVIAAGNFVQLGLRVLLGPLVPLLLVEFDTSKATLGLVLTGVWGVYALHQFPSGVLADRFGERPMLVAGLLGAIAGGVLVGLSPSLWVFGAFALVLGAGAGLYFSPASSLISRLYAEHGGPLGWLTSAGAVAGVVYPAIGTLIAVRYGWRTAVIAGAVTGLPVLLAIRWYVPAPPPSNPERRLRVALDLTRMRSLLARRRVAFTVGVGVLFGFAFQGLISFFPTFLVEYYRLDPSVAGVGFAALFGLSSIAQPIAGRLSDRFTRDTALAMSATVAASGLLVLLANLGTGGLVAGTVLLGFGISWPGVLQARFMDQFGDAERGYGFGLVRTVYMLLAATGSLVVGAFADYHGWLLGYGTIVVLFLVSLGALAANRVLALDL